MEKHFYLRETQGPGAYLSQNAKSLSRTKTSTSYSIPKSDRGLLTSSPSKQPGPQDYENCDLNLWLKKDSNFKMQRATRDIPFSKYNGVFKELVSKGI
jgi:hypothetical protein